MVREDEGEGSSGAEEVLHTECIGVDIVCRLVGIGHEVDDVALRAYEEDLEDDVVVALR